MLELPELRRDIELLWRQAVGRRGELADYEPLTHDDCIHVARVRLACSANDPSTVIVKHVRPDRYPVRTTEDMPPAFAEEQFIYRFLADLDPCFARCPRVLAAAPGIMLLSDLGEHRRDAPAEAIMPRMAETLADLHTRTVDAYPLYTRLRRSASLGEDRRMYSLGEYASLFQFGGQLIEDYCRELGMMTPDCDAILRDVRETILDPGPFRAFIHDDLAARRQFFLVDDRCFLIDFEMGKYAHILLDVCKPLVGKFDCKRGTNYFFLNHLNFPVTFADCYRESLAAVGGIAPSDDVWDHALSSALIFTTVVNLGALTCVTQPYQPLESHEGMTKQLLERLLLLLDGNESHAALKPSLHSLAEKIVP